MGIKALNLEKYTKYAAILLLFVFGTSLLRSYQKTIKTKALVEREKKKIEELKKENARLEGDLERVKSEEFIERQLRDKLGLAKKGEVVLVLPDAETLKRLAPKMGEEEEVLPDPIWKKWADLFF